MHILVQQKMKLRYCGSHKYKTSIHTTPVPAPADLRFIAAASTSRITTTGGGGVCIGVCSISTGRWRRNPNLTTPMMSSYGYRRRRCRVPSRFCYPSSSSSDSYKDSGELSHSYDEDDVCAGDEDDVCAGDDDVEIWIEETGNNRRRIQSRVSVKASLQIVWNILTDYEKLADFIPGLAVSQVLQKADSFARLFQIGQQDLAFGLKFKAKGVIDCYEKDLQNFPSGQRRDIEFNMIEGDFQLFQGKWSVEQICTSEHELVDSVLGQDFDTTLSYVVDVEPKVWLPVRLVQGRVCKEIKMNLLCIKKAAEREIQNKVSAY